MKHMESARNIYLEKIPASDVEWAVQNACIVHQCYQMFSSQVHRNLSMATNIKWIIDQAPPKTKVVLWAHNGHVNTIGHTMGAFLDQCYGDEMVVIGLTCAEWRYTAVGDDGLDLHDLQPPLPGSVEHCFQNTNLQQFILDLRKAYILMVYFEKTTASRLLK